MPTTWTTADATISTTFSIMLSRRELGIECRVNGIRFSDTRLVDETILCKDRTALLQVKLEFFWAVTVGVVIVAFRTTLLVVNLVLGNIPKHTPFGRI